MARNNPLHDSQTNPSAFELGRRMEPLENAEKLLHVLRVEPDAIVANEENCFERFLLGADLDLSFGAREK